MNRDLEPQYSKEENNVWHCEEVFRFNTTLYKTQLELISNGAQSCIPHSSLTASNCILCTNIIGNLKMYSWNSYFEP